MKERYGKEVPLWLRILGAWRVNAGSIDFKWGYFAPHRGLELVLHRGGYFDQRFALSVCVGWGKFHFYLPFNTKLGEGCDLPQYGFAVHSGTFWIYTGGEYDESFGQCVSGDKWITWDLPFFTHQFDGHWILDKNKRWVRMGNGIASWDFRKEQAYIETHPYTYKLKNGEVQERDATVTKERRMWHRKWFPFLKMVHTDIDVSFNKEVGERTGSWKGGVVGAGYTMLQNETMLQTLRRMEKERAFN